MKWVLLAIFLCTLLLLVVGRAIPVKRRAGHHSSQGKMNFESYAASIAML